MLFNSAYFGIKHIEVCSILAQMCYVRKKSATCR